MDRGPASHPQTPKAPQDPRGSGGGSRLEGAGFQGQQGASEGPPDKENTPTRGNNGSVEPPGQSGRPSGHDTATNQGTASEEGYGHPTVGKSSEGEGSGHEGPSAEAPAGHQSGSGARSAEEPSRLPAEAAVDTSAPLPTTLHGEDPAELARVFTRLSDHQDVETSRAVDPVAAAPEGVERRSAGYPAQTASGPPFGSTEYLFSYLWNQGGFTVQRAKDGLGSMQGGARGFVTGTPHGGVLTQRAPPLQIPSPYSGVGPVMGGAASGTSSSGVGSAPLLAVIVCCLCAVLWRGRSRSYSAFLRPGTVPRVALERPG